MAASAAATAAAAAAAVPATATCWAATSKDGGKSVPGFLGVTTLKALRCSPVVSPPSSVPSLESFLLFTKKERGMIFRRKSVIWGSTQMAVIFFKWLNVDFLNQFFYAYVCVYI